MDGIEAALIGTEAGRAHANGAGHDARCDVDHLDAIDVADVKLNQQNAALSTQDDQKRLVAAESTLGRFPKKI